MPCNTARRGRVEARQDCADRGSPSTTKTIVGFNFNPAANGVFTSLGLGDFSFLPLLLLVEETFDRIPLLTALVSWVRLAHFHPPGRG